MKQHAINALATSALLFGATSGFAGEPAPYIPVPAPAPECGNPGWTVTAAALYLKSYASSDGLISGSTEGEWDWGFRGSVGYERPDGLFFRAVGFWWEGDLTANDEGPFREGDDFGKLKAYSVDLLVGDTFCPTENTSVEISAGVRYGYMEENTEERFRGYDYEFSGWGPTFQIRGRRALTDTIALYADFQQSFLFGEAEQKFNRGDNGPPLSETDTLASITEIRGGIEFGWGWNQIRNAYLRLGAEGQYWVVDGFDLGLVGGMAEVGFTF